MQAVFSAAQKRPDNPRADVDDRISAKPFLAVEPVPNKSGREIVSVLTMRELTEHIVSGRLARIWQNPPL